MVERVDSPVGCVADGETAAVEFHRPEFIRKNRTCQPIREVSIAPPSLGTSVCFDRGDDA
jgi:hypothetical protein